MALGISLEEAVVKVGHSNGMRNYEVVRALGNVALTTKSAKAEKPYYDPSILRIRGPKSRWHLVFFHEGRVYDPGIPYPAPSLKQWEDYIISGRGWRVVSQIPLKILGSRA